jgi:hypothetical protein
MIAIRKPSRETVCAEDQQNEQFFKLVPAIRRYALLAFRHLRPQDRDEALCEVLAHAFCAFRRLVELGKRDVVYASPLARFAVAHIRAGRRVGTKFKSRDVFAVANHCRRAVLSHWVDMLADDSLTPVADQVAFRLDFADWLRALNERKRKLVKFLALGNSPSEAAERFEISNARVSQLRSELYASWQVFQGEPLPSTATVRNGSKAEAR